MHPRVRLTRFQNQHFNEAYWDELFLDDIASESRDSQSNHAKIDSALDREAVKLHRLLTDASDIAPPRGLVERTIARIDKNRMPNWEL